jgi:uncharacterized protein (TIGR02118 family)
MSVRVSVFYGGSEGRFDYDYYVDQHVPMVYELLREHGCRRIEVDRGVGGGAPGAPAPYAAVGHMEFESLEEFEAGMSTSGSRILADVPNYTDMQPLVQLSEITTVLP